MKWRQIVSFSKFSLVSENDFYAKFLFNFKKKNRSIFPTKPEVGICFVFVKDKPKVRVTPVRLRWGFTWTFLKTQRPSPVQFAPLRVPRRGALNNIPNSHKILFIHLI